nr:MAG TPA: hypothetical protein [Bacteriophage sp.]
MVRCGPIPYSGVMVMFCTDRYCGGMVKFSYGFVGLRVVMV